MVRREVALGALAGLMLAVAAAGYLLRATSEQPPSPAGSGSFSPTSTGVTIDRRPRAAGFVGLVLAGESVDIEPRSEGRIEEVLVKPGDRVLRGAPIARLDVRAMVQELAIARAALAGASHRYARRRLAGRVSEAVTAEELDTARLEVAQERAKVAILAQATREAMVPAPFEGTVAERYLSAGALAGPGRPIVRLVGAGPPRVRFAVPEKDAAALAVGATITVEVGRSRVAGAISDLNAEVDVSAGMLYGTAMLYDPAPETLPAGAICRVFLTPATAAAAAGVASQQHARPLANAEPPPTTPTTAPPTPPPTTTPRRKHHAKRHRRLATPAPTPEAPSEGPRALRLMEKW
jgi:RND family efflux transporter MFP subunit